MTAYDRPLSPHLQIWKWGLHMALSIAHRATGIANAAGALLLVLWLHAAASGPETYARFVDLLLTPLGRLVLFGITLSLCMHLATGIRHLVMDSGRALEKTANRRLGYFAVFLGVFLAVAIWVAAYWHAGLI
ncbi:MAG: succinate dehydrogenase, cytochrome b556 subunit [Rhodothalassiaceae bacterium]